MTHIHLEQNRHEKGLRSLMIYGFLTPLTSSETRLLADLYLACNIPLEAAWCYEDWIKQQGKGSGKTGKILDIMLGSIKREVGHVIPNFTGSPLPPSQTQHAPFSALRFPLYHS